MKLIFENYQPKVEELITLRQAAKLCGLTTSHLRRLLGNYKLWGIKIDSIWLTMEYAVQVYLASNPHPGPKPK